jgi:hypothetical protein
VKNLEKPCSKNNSGDALPIVITVIAVLMLMGVGAVIINAFYSALFGSGFFAVLAVVGFIGICILVLLGVLKGR